ncbi:hypothetical protein MLD38_012649 [Melastoma candidum]|uniref:Uncharacterized protein n=1 Tax=Melastoma candidum TaxID=119954 RepID=A0ACB9R6K4_9MYRT|nr:hypothetical protein MLD38_012649 [Melastoma candidum]
MTIGEEVSGSTGPKVARLVYFVGAGFITVLAINKWREWERRQQQQQQNQHPPLNDQSSGNHVHKPVQESRER